MVRKTVWTVLLVIGVLAIGCGKSTKKDTEASKEGAKGAATVANAAASQRPKTPVNRIKLFTMTAKSPKDLSWQDYKSTIDMTSAIFTWNKEQAYFVFSNDASGCDTKTRNVRPSWKPVSPAQRKGEVALDGKTFKANMAAIYARSFNAMFMMNADSQRTVHFVSGRVKAGETLKGWVDIKEKIPGSEKYSLIRGNFELKVCKGLD